MPRYIDVDALWKDVTSNIDYCADFLEIIERQPTVTINDHSDENIVTNCNHIAEDSKKVSFSWPHENGKDAVYREDVIELAMQYCPDDDGTCSKAGEDIRNLLDELETLPSAQPEPAIPLSWIEGQIKWLKSLDNDYLTLTAGLTTAMVNKWKDEQNE